ncbi:MAG: OmpA family protein [Candidatus Rokubacteria bacterium]|nr:OmpA family protein [Candidatus Rokubacteria bacterium]MBI3105472.1 OmpA family protein [Candidatus Rokubacteria bacterium]
MTGKVVSLMLCAGVALSATACATKGFVGTQVGQAEARLGQVSQRVDEQDATLRDTKTRVEEARQSIDVHGQRLQGLDGKVMEAGALASEATTVAREARKGADEAAASARDVDGRLTQRLANRNRYAPVETRTLYFAFGKAELRDEAINELGEVVKILKEDPNAVVELQGHTDSVGNDRLNLRLSRERADAVVRHLVHKHGIELRRIHALGLGKAVPVANNDTQEGRAKNRRLDIRILAPQA